MFEDFSRGYYLGRMYVEPYDGDRAVMQRAQHERVNEQLYRVGEDAERLDERLDGRLVMKLGPQHFPVHGERDVPQDTLALPEELLSTARIRNPPALKEVLLAKADRATQLLNLAGYGPDPSVGT